MQPATNTRVFLVDDSVSIRKRLLVLLSELEGVSVVGEAESPNGAIEGIVVTDPDSVVLDIHLNGGSGLKVLQETRAAASEIIFIVLTNYPNPQYRKVYMEAGADYFLDKTTEFEKVAEIISALGATRH